MVTAFHIFTRLSILFRFVPSVMSDNSDCYIIGMLLLYLTVSVGSVQLTQ
jgi:hypothetical protein